MTAPSKALAEDSEMSNELVTSPGSEHLMNPNIDDPADTTEFKSSEQPT